MYSGFSTDVLFFKYRRDAKETAADSDMSCFTPHMMALSWIPCSAHPCLKVTMKYRVITGSLGSIIFFFICTCKFFSYLAYVSDHF